MATYPFDVEIKAPQQLKKGESARVLINFPVASGTTVEVYIVDPSGRTIPVSMKVNPVVAGRSALSARYFEFAFGSVGTYFIFVYVEVAPTPDIYTGATILHVSEWLNNIDARVSDIARANTEISRLRTIGAKQGNALL